MNLKNHTGERYVVLQGEQNEVANYTAGHTFPWYCKTLPTTTGGRLATYLLGFLVTVADLIFVLDGEMGEPFVDDDDLARALFESCELKNTLFGKPISHNYYKGSFFPLGGFIGNGMRRPLPMGLLHQASSAPQTTRLNYFVPACSLLGLKGHHTAQLACCYDGATFELKTAGTPLPGMTIASATIRVSAILVSEPEIRLGPGTQFVRYEQTTGASATKHMIEALGNTGSLSGVDTGAGIAFLAWMTSRKGHGGSFAHPYNLEYMNVPFRGLDQIVTLDPLFADYLGACGNLDAAPMVAQGQYGGPYPTTGCLYDYDNVGDKNGLLDGLFVPLISPKRFMEVTKMQSVEGTQEVNAKIGSETFAGQDVYYALQYHSWTPALQEQFLRKVVDSGVARAVWGTNDLKPKTKLLAKQPAGELNLAKTRYLPLTWEPQAPQVNPPGPASAK